jgi:hypothetical protein
MTVGFQTVLPATIIVKGKTTSGWASTNPILKKYELGAELTTTPGTVLLKVGDGVTAWSSLQYVAAAGGGGGGGNVATDVIWDNAGDLAVGSGSNAAVKLPKGTALQYLRVNSAGTALEYATLSITSADIANGTIVDADISATAGIVRSKLNFGTGLVNTDISGSAGIVRTKLDFGTGLVDADINASAGIVRSKLNFGTGLVNTDLATGAAIDIAKLNATGTRDGSHALFGDGTWKTTTGGASDTSNQNIFSYRGNGRKWAAGLAASYTGAGVIIWKADVRVATTAAGTLATSFANGQSVDGVTLATNDRILIKNQVTGSENGFYTVNASGAPTRTTDADTANELPRAGAKVTSGTTNANTFWYQTSGPVTVGTTTLSFAKFKPAKLIDYGDSVTELMYGNVVTRIRNRMARYNGKRVSPGWINGAPDSSLATGGVNILQPYKFRLTAGSYNTPTGKNIVEERGLGLYTFYGNSTTPSVLTLSDTSNANTTAVFAVAEFHYTASGTLADAGSLEIRIDGTLVNTITTYDAALGAGKFESGRTYTWVGTEAAHTVTVTFITNPARFEGVYLAYGDEMVWVYNGGNAGEKFNDFLFVQTGHTNPPTLEAGKSVDADAVILSYGINDYADGLSAMGTDVTSAINTTKAMIDDVSLGILIPYATQTRTDWESYVTAIKTSASNLSVPVIDTSWMLKPNLGAGSVGGDPHDLVVDSDNTHETTAGGIVWADMVANFLLGDNINWMYEVEAMAIRLLGRQTGLSISLDEGQTAATFYTPPFDSALYLKSYVAGSTLAQMTMQHNAGAATSGTLAQISFAGHDGTGPIQSGTGIPTAIAWMRAITNGALSPTSRAVEFAFGNTAVGSTTVAERMRILAGGWLQFGEFAAPAGTASKVALGARLSGSNHQAGFLMPDSSVRVVASSSFTDADVDPTVALRPTNALAETFNRAETATANLAAVMTSGQLFMVAVALRAGMTVTSIVFVSGTTSVVSPTHWWFSLHDSARVLLGQTADQTTTTTNWTGTPAAVSLVLASAYPVVTSGLYYLAIMFTAGTMPTLLGAAGNATPWAIAPILNGNSSSTGLTTTAPGTAGAITGGTARPYAYVL